MKKQIAKINFYEREIVENQMSFVMFETLFNNLIILRENLYQEARHLIHQQSLEAKNLLVNQTLKYYMFAEKLLRTKKLNNVEYTHLMRHLIEYGDKIKQFDDKNQINERENIFFAKIIKSLKSKNTAQADCRIRMIYHIKQSINKPQAENE